MKRFEKKHLIAVSIVGVLLFSAAVGIYKVLEPEVIDKVSLPIHQVPLFERNLDGVLIKDKNKIDLRPFAIMIDNHEDARPRVGTENASIVYETVAEGQITRLLMVFDPEEVPEAIGPIRSVRPYFIDFTNEHDAIVIHVGGSPEALEKISTVDSIDEFREGGTTFWREDSRRAPHDTFTSKEKLLKSRDMNNYSSTTSSTAWTYTSKRIDQEQSIRRININFSFPEYNVTWVYDAVTNTYSRYVNGLSENDNANNLIVRVVTTEVIDDELRRRLTLIDEGVLWYFHDGTLTLGSWGKRNNTTKTMYKDNEGNEIILNSGKTWISIIDDEGKIQFD